MATFLMVGKYCCKSLENVSPERTEQAVELIKKHSGEIHSMHATLGQNDLIFLLEFPGMKEAMRASVAMSKLTGIAFTTCPAVTVKMFDRLMGNG